MSKVSIAVSIAIDDILADRKCSTITDGDDLLSKIHKTLDHMNSIAREVARTSWSLRRGENDRDEQMQIDVGLLVARVLILPWGDAYPELSSQIERVLRDAFNDEHFKLDDPAGWAEVNEDLPARMLH